MCMCVIILSENKPAAERNIWYDSICYEEFFLKLRKMIDMFMQIRMETY